MEANFFLPGELREYGDLALLKTLREYQRARSQFLGKGSPAFYTLHEQMTAAICMIENELVLRGHPVKTWHC